LNTRLLTFPHHLGIGIDATPRRDTWQLNDLNRRKSTPPPSHRPRPDQPRSTPIEPLSTNALARSAIIQGPPPQAQPDQPCSQTAAPLSTSAHTRTARSSEVAPLKLSPTNPARSSEATLSTTARARTPIPPRNDRPTQTP
jgi:hypothetical protein